MSVTFTTSEIKALQGCPEALRLIADWNSCQETMADAIDPEIFADSCEYHRKRYTMLREEADRIEAEY